jgi:hypothetical protein
MKTNILIYEDTPKYDLWLKLILGGVLALTFILGVIFIYQDVEAAVAMFGITLFDALLFKAILPRRYQIFEDRLRILMGGPFTINIPFSNIEEAKPASGSKAFAYGGLRLATSTRHVVEIVRKKGLNLVISPSNGDMFLEQLNQARQTIGNPN